MNKKEFSQLLKSKTVSALLELLKQGQSGEIKIDPDNLQAIIDELNSRKLSSSEQSEFDNILDSSFEETQEAPNKFTNDEIEKITGSSDGRDIEPRKYSALKTVVGLISLLGWIVIIIGIGALIYMGSNGQVLMGFVALVVSIIIALPYLAISNLVYVFIDTEYNTRKTREILDKLLKKK